MKCTPHPDHTFHVHFYFPRIGPLLLFALSPALVQAQATPSSEAIDVAVGQLESPREAEVREGLEALGVSGTDRAAVAISARIGRGLPPGLLGFAIEMLSLLGKPDARPVLLRLLGHRRADVRRLAVRGLAACAPATAPADVASAVDDSDPSVRELAVDTLAELGATSATAVLANAAEREVPGAYLALATVVAAEELDRLLDFVGRRPLGELRSALLTVLTRPDLPTAARTQVVARVGELATPGARAVLESALAQSENPLPSTLRRSVESALTRLP